MLYSPKEPYKGEYSQLAPKTSNLAPEPTIKQVKFNTFSCAGGIYRNIINAIHHHLARTGAYNLGTSPQNPITPSALPTAKTITSIPSGLATAHTAYWWRCLGVVGRDEKHWFGQWEGSTERILKDDDMLD